MHIVVTQEHIDEGEAGKFSGCPIALALNEATGRSWGVGLLFAHEFEKEVPIWHERSLLRTIKLSQSITNFIQSFDRGVDVQPSEVDLDAEALTLETVPCTSE